MREEVRSNLEAHVSALSERIGIRGWQDTDKLALSADYIEKSLAEAGVVVGRQPFMYAGKEYENVIGEVSGREPEIFLVGAHYDTVSGSPGADDNASGVAGMIEIARLAARNPLPLTMRFVAFCLEEPPAFRTSRMGSFVYAESLRKEDAQVAGMVSLEMIGYFTEKKGSQFYPLPFMRWHYPRKGNYIAFVGNIGSRGLTRRLKDAFRRHSELPVESLNTVSAVPGVDFSDHRSFWKFGYPALMVTDTAFYRNPNYHGHGDRASTLDYGKMAEVVLGLYGALGELEVQWRMGRSRLR
jgi:Zn-dependent M28 family amino/carboxypeptidase